MSLVSQTPPTMHSNPLGWQSVRTSPSADIDDDDVSTTTVGNCSGDGGAAIRIPILVMFVRLFT